MAHCGSPPSAWTAMPCVLSARTIDWVCTSTPVHGTLTHASRSWCVPTNRLTASGVNRSETHTHAALIAITRVYDFQLGDDSVVASFEGLARDTVVRRLAHEPLRWLPTMLEVMVSRHRCREGGQVWRQDTTEAAEPRAKLSRGGLRWALAGIVVQGLTADEDVHGLDLVRVDGGDVAQVLRVGPVAGDDEVDPDVATVIAPSDPASPSP